MNVMATFCLKKLECRQQKTVKACGTIKKKLEEHVAFKYVDWHQISNMIGHKNRTLERQSLSEVKIARDSAICKKIFKQIVEQTMRLVRRLCIFHYIQYMISLKDSENLEPSLCARDMDENQYLMYRSSCGAALKTSLKTFIKK